MTCYGFFQVGHKEFGNLLITDYTVPVKTYTLGFIFEVKILSEIGRHLQRLINNLSVYISPALLGGSVFTPYPTMS
jgi:hypothetical protein